MPSMLSIEAIEETEVTKQTTSGKVEFRWLNAVDVMYMSLA